ncbi:uncharacterized protein J3R85_003988 [Psidium guajava]|nr:uncharacterized protein J3R85_003988 [Psidium guajava]
MSNNEGAMEILMNPHAFTPKTVTRSESNPHSTTFIHADTTNLK